MIRTKKAYGCEDGTQIAFDENAAIIDAQRNPRGTRIWPVAREPGHKNFHEDRQPCPEVS